MGVMQSILLYTIFFNNKKDRIGRMQSFFGY